MTTATMPPRHHATN